MSTTRSNSSRSGSPLPLPDDSSIAAELGDAQAAFLPNAPMSLPSPGASFTTSAATGAAPLTDFSGSGVTRIQTSYSAGSLGACRNSTGLLPSMIGGLSPQASSSAANTAAWATAGGGDGVGGGADDPAVPTPSTTQRDRAATFTSSSAGGCMSGAGAAGAAGADAQRDAGLADLLAPLASPLTPDAHAAMHVADLLSPPTAGGRKAAADAVAAGAAAAAANVDGNDARDLPGLGPHSQPRHTVSLNVTSSGGYHAAADVGGSGLGPGSASSNLAPSRSGRSKQQLFTYHNHRWHYNEPADDSGSSSSSSGEDDDSSDDNDDGQSAGSGRRSAHAASSRSKPQQADSKFVPGGSSAAAGVGEWPTGRGRHSMEAVARGGQQQQQPEQHQPPPPPPPPYHRRSSSDAPGGVTAAQATAGALALLSVEPSGRSDTVLSMAHHGGGGQAAASSSSRRSVDLSRGLTGPAALELFMRLNHARQTLDFAKRQAAEFSALDKAELSVWEALDLLSELREYESALTAGSSSISGSGSGSSGIGGGSGHQVAAGGGSDVSLLSPAALTPDMPLVEHAYQCAELCRLAHPDKDWMALAGLLHGLGKLLAHSRFGSQPQWAVCGETFPVGCRFSPAIACPEFFSVNPDRRKRGYQTPLGIYAPGCGLHNVYMSWGAPEYMSLVLLLNAGPQLPKELLFLVRYHKFSCLVRGGPGTAGYRHLLCPDDEDLLPLLHHFQALTAYTRVALPQDKALTGAAFREHYSRLIEKYIGVEKLMW